METYNHKNGCFYRIDYNKIRITSIKDFRNLKKVLVEGFIRLAGGRRLNLKGFIPYSSIGNEARGMSEDAYVTTYDKAIALIEDTILKLPFGVKAAELTDFEVGMLRAVARTLVMANSNYVLLDENTLNDIELLLEKKVVENGYAQVNIPVHELAQEFGISDDDCLESLSLGEYDDGVAKPYMLVENKDGTSVISASADMGTCYYTITEHPNRRQAQEAPNTDEGNAQDSDDHEDNSDDAELSAEEN